MLFGNMLAYYMWLRDPLEAKIQAADPSGAGHFGDSVFQDVEAIPVLISASGKDNPNPQVHVP